MATPTILICDDEPNLRELMRVSLGDGYVFAEANDVEQSIELAERLRPALVLLDIMMPGGSGLEVVERLRADPNLADTRVVVVSAFAAERDRIAAQAAGANGFLGKPVDPEELGNLVEELLATGG